MPIALRRGSNGYLQDFQTGEVLSVDQVERLSGSGNLVVGSNLGASEELRLSSSAALVRSLGSHIFDGSLLGGTIAGADLTLESTSNATKGDVIIAAGSAMLFNDMAAPTNPADGQGRLYKKTGNDGLFWLPDSGGSEIDLTSAGGGGEANTASNVGTDGVGVFNVKSGIDLQFRHVAPASTRVSVALNGQDIDVDVVQANLDHGSIGGLADDDHTQYHTDARGDARYYTQGTFITVSAGVGSAGLPIVLDAAGHVDATMINDADIDHGSIGGLADDDHTQYHTDARGDARYYQQSQFISTSVGAGDAGKPIVLDAAGHIDASMINDADIDHGSIGGLADDDHTQYHTDTRGDARYYQQSQFISTSAGVGDAGKPIVLDAAGHVDATMINDGDIDHGSIGGLADDDHTQYHTDARGDARYYQQSQFISTSAGAGDAGKPVVLDAAGHVDATMINDADIDHGSVGGLTDDDHTQYALLAGRATGQSLTGGTAAGDDLTLASTSNATKGDIIIAAGSAMLFNDMAAPANPADGQGRLYKKTGNDGLFWLPDSGGSEIDLTSTGGGGEANTASNVGTDGVGVFNVKSGVDLQFRHIAPASTKVTVTLNVQDIDIDVVEANLDHGSIGGLADDDHTQYALLLGRAGGQTLIGGTAAFDGLLLQSTSNVTKGDISLDGRLVVTDVGAVDVDPAINQNFTVTATGTGGITLQATGTGAILIDTDGGDIDLTPTGILNVDASSNIVLNAGNNLDFDSAGTTQITSVGQATISAGSSSPANLLLRALGGGGVMLDAPVDGAFALISAGLTARDGAILFGGNGYQQLNWNYATDAAITGGLVVNYDPTTTVDTVAGAYVAGVAATSNPTVTTTGSATFATGDIIQLGGSKNPGLYEVLTHSGTTLTVRGVGTTDTVEAFSIRQFIAGASDAAPITKVAVAVLRVGTDGVWETGAGSTTGISYTDVGAGGVTDHGALTGLTDDDHSIYALLAGRSGGQSLIGGTAAGDDLTLTSTSNATKGDVIIAAGSAMLFNDMAAPANPADGQGRLYKKTGNDGLFWLPDSAGPEVDLTATVGGSSTYLALTDTPSAFTGAAEQLTGVNTTPDAIEFKPLTKVRAEATLVIDNTLRVVAIGENGPANWGTATGVDVVAIGDNAAGSLTTGHSFVAIGTNAAQNITADFESVYIGYNAGGVGTGTGAQYNTAIGFNALRGVAATVIGQANTALGAGTGENVTAASANLFAGAYAGEDVSTGSNNVLLGYNTAGGAINLTTGNRNIVIGTFTDTPAIDSNDFIVIGDMSGGNLGSRVIVDPANDNIYMGANNPGNYGTSTGNHNSNLGDGTGIALTTGSNNTNLGANAGATITIGSGNLCVGVNTDVPTASTNDHLNIGNTIYGDLSTDRVRIGGTGAVTVNASLELAGTNGAFLPNRLTTTQRDALTPVTSMLVYNSTTAQFEFYNGSTWTAFGGGVSDHGGLTGLADDDHTQYHTDARGDARYYQQSQFISTSAGAGDAGKPVVLDAAGNIDATMINDADIDHGSVGGLTDDDHTQYALLAGRSGGQSLIGGTASGDDLTLTSTSNATKGDVIIAAGSAMLFNDMAAPANPADGQGRLYKKTGNDGLFWLPDSGGSEIDLTSTGGGGEANTASNVGTDGVGVFNVKSGVDLQFRHIAPASTKVTVALNGQDIDIDVAEANLDHGSIGGLADDDHTQYALLLGRAGGQTLNGGSGAGDDLLLRSTTSGTKGDVSLDSRVTVNGAGAVLVDPTPGQNVTVTTLSFGDIVLNSAGDLDLDSAGVTTITSAGQATFSAGGASPRNLLLQALGGGGVAISAPIDGAFITLSAGLTARDGAILFGGNGYQQLNWNYTADTAITGGFVVNYDPTTTVDTVNGSYVAGVAATSNPTVTTTGSATFTVGDIVQFGGSKNPGLYEVLSHTGTTLTVRGVGTTDTVEAFSIRQFVAGTSDSAAITKVNVSILRVGTDGVWETGAGSTTGITYTNITDHGGLVGLADDDHTQYALLAGRSGGQTLIGGTAASNNLTLESTSNATKGSVVLATGTRLDVSDEDLVNIATATFGNPQTQTVSTASMTIDFSAGQKHRITLGANVTSITFTDPPGAGNFTVEFIQDGTGTRTVTGWPANVFWLGGTDPTFGDAAGARRLVSFYYNGPTEDDYYGEYNAGTYS